jgi:hypothetical protein
VGVPTSVLLAVLAAAGLLALAPALVRRYDATERLVAERTRSTARVIERRRRRRTVPGRHPVNPPRAVSVVAVGRASVPPAAPVSAALSVAPISVAPVSAAPVSVVPVSVVPVSAGATAVRRRRRRRPARRRYAPAVYRRRRVLSALLLLNVAELAGLAAVGSGFAVGMAFSGVLLLGYLVHLRRRAVTERRHRRALARQAARLAVLEARRQEELARRRAVRREALRRAAAARAAAQREALRLSQRYLDGSRSYLDGSRTYDGPQVYGGSQAHEGSEAAGY